MDLGCPGIRWALPAAVGCSAVPVTVPAPVPVLDCARRRCAVRAVMCCESDVTVLKCSLVRGNARPAQPRQWRPRFGMDWHWQAPPGPRLPPESNRGAPAGSHRNPLLPVVVKVPGPSFIRVARRHRPPFKTPHQGRPSLTLWIGAKLSFVRAFHISLHHFVYMPTHTLLYI